jgi:hypothetical protein
MGEGKTGGGWWGGDAMGVPSQSWVDDRRWGGTGGVGLEGR